MHVDKKQQLKFYTDGIKLCLLSHVYSIYNLFSMLPLDPRIIKYVSAPGSFLLQ